MNHGPVVEQVGNRNFTLDYFFGLGLGLGLHFGSVLGQEGWDGGRGDGAGLIGWNGKEDGWNW